MWPEWREGGGWLRLHVDEVADVSGARHAGKGGGWPGGGDGEKDWAGVQAGDHHATEYFLWEELLDTGTV